MKQSFKQKVPDAPVASTSDAKVCVDSNPCVLLFVQKHYT